ncbi:type VII secretion protein EssB/YukC [Fructilactobacillus carniphilus]|uniref:Type VII secretion protein EssB n=1 Tax=Fructilactobacillus carniphilus TaxID=2940297 RepID=A0ABY5BY38_9LACO|nr:type VII secretion protein EssB/YukC [Fructilactobacillus carniphilus]USS90288.1 hypothetical protein M3M37_05445 [Fructilactobacillus carniphilus]
MREISNGEMNLKINYLDDKIEVFLEAKQVQEGTMDIINDYLESDDNLFLTGKISHQEDGSYKIVYNNPGSLVSLRNMASHSSHFNRLKLALRVINLVNVPHYRFVMFLNPRNMVVTPNQDIKVAHRGIHELMDPMEITEAEKLKQIKAMIISIVVNKVEFDDVINDSKLIAKNKFAAKIIAIDSFEQLQNYMTKLTAIESKHQNSITKTMPKWVYRTLVWGSGLLLLISIVICISWAVSLHKTQGQRMELQSTNAYLDGRYQDAVNVMAKQNPDRLSVEEQYVLAQSYVHLSNLNNGQKTKFLDQLSPNSDNNLVMFWISDGRKKYNDELNYAKKLNDNELILHAYQQLLLEVKDNGSISGEKKQKLLKEYQDAVNSYQKKVSPKKDKNDNK